MASSNEIAAGTNRAHAKAPNNKSTSNTVVNIQIMRALAWSRIGSPNVTERNINTPIRKNMPKWKR